MLERAESQKVGVYLYTIPVMTYLTAWLYLGEAIGWDANNDHAWFIAYAPARAPRVAVAVLVENGGLGGHVAGPTGMQILKAYFARAAGETTAPPRNIDAGTSSREGSKTP